MDGQSKTFLLPSQVIADLNRLYNDLEKRRDRDFAATGKRLGDLVLLPLGPMLKRANAVQFTVAENLISLPLDLLSFEGEPLFLQKPVTFELPPAQRTVPKPLGFSTRWSGLMMRDRTADPENGVSFLATVLPGSSSVATLRQLRRTSPVDVLLVSGHGDVGDEGDSVSVGDDELEAHDLARLSPRLVYLDSCQLGISLDFLHAFRRVGTEYYLAPILSNEAGNSSTKTIRLFFRGLKETGSPSEALFRTRRQLYREFKDDPPAQRLWRAYPFRLYRLGEGHEP